VAGLSHGVRYRGLGWVPDWAAFWGVVMECELSPTLMAVTFLAGMAAGILYVKFLFKVMDEGRPTG